MYGKRKTAQTQTEFEPAITKRARTMSARTSTIPKGWQVARMPRGFLGAAGDAKFFDKAAASYAMDTTGSITHIDVVPQGTTVNEREGKAFAPTSVHVRGYANSGTEGLTTQGVLYLIWDYQPNKALASITDVLDSTSSVSFPKRENAGRFKILRQLRYVFSGESDNSAVSGPNVFDIDEYVRIPKDCVALCTAADTTGAIGNRISGALLAITVGRTAAGTAAAGCTVGYRVNFMDI